MGPVAVWREAEALKAIFGTDGPLQAQREKLCRAIRFGEIDPGAPELLAYLRNSVHAQVQIDQPGYAGALESARNA